VERISKLETLAVTNIPPWWWRWYAHLKRRLATGTRRHIPEDAILDRHRHGNVKSYIRQQISQNNFTIFGSLSMQSRHLWLYCLTINATLRKMSLTCFILKPLECSQCWNEKMAVFRCASQTPLRHAYFFRLKWYDTSSLMVLCDIETHLHEEDTIFHKRATAWPCKLVYANSLFPHRVTRVSATSYKTAASHSKKFRVMIYWAILLCYLQPPHLSLAFIISASTKCPFTHRTLLWVTVHSSILRPELGHRRTVGGPKLRS
jgi:hypothetical protein